MAALVAGVVLLFAIWVFAEFSDTHKEETVWLHRHRK